MKPSRKAVHKARLAAAYRKHREGREFFRPVLITGHRVEFRYGGHLIQFVWESGRVLRIGTDSYPYLQPEDYALLHSEAAILMQAAIHGYKKNREPKQAESVNAQKNKQLQFIF